MNSWRLGRRPALDGLRGVAVLLVIGSHAMPEGSSWRYLGYAGVTMFFTLSGFLITSLLLQERRDTGRVDLTAFWGRRARRLLPALLVIVLTVTLVELALGRWDWLSMGALTYTANLMLAAGHGDGSPLSHTWSLALEEQFYILWPLVLLAVSRHGRRALTTGVITLAVVSAVVPLTMYADGFHQLYYSPQARASPLVAGCLLAVWMSTRRDRGARPAVAALAVAGVVAVTLLPYQQLDFPLGREFMLLLGPQCVAVLTCVALFSVAQSGGAAWLSGRVLRWFGTRSYGLYLWHFPIMVGLSQVAPRTAVVLGGIPLALAVTELSWRYVEQPFRRRRPEPQSSLAPAALAALTP